MSLKYRKQRIKNLALQWKGKTLNDLFMVWKIPNELWTELKFFLSLYISRAMDISFKESEKEFLNLVNINKNNKNNITPNGAIVPKKEYQLEYNLFLKTWCTIARKMVEPNSKLLNLFRLTPNVRIKFGEETRENIGRGLNTAIPHSDAWVEGQFGLNCHVPVFGDVENNFLQYYKLIDENNFNESFLTTAENYQDMEWVLEHYQVDDNLKPLLGHINLSDYALIHRTFRNNNSGIRISIDTTINSGDHLVHPERKDEYMDQIPNIGNSIFIKIHRSVKDGFIKEKSSFKHYTSGDYTIVNF